MKIGYPFFERQEACGIINAKDDESRSRGAIIERAKTMKSLLTSRIPDLNRKLRGIVLEHVTGGAASGALPWIKFFVVETAENASFPHTRIPNENNSWDRSVAHELLNCLSHF
jgi:hypothetical protein